MDCRWFFLPCCYWWCKSHFHAVCCHSYLWISIIASFMFLPPVVRFIYVACNLRTCAVCRLHGAKYAVCRLHGTQSADCMVTVRTKDPSKTCDSFSKFQRNLRFSARINFLTKLPNLKEITSVFLTMVIIHFLACNWGKQWQVCSHGMNGCCDELDSLLPKCPPSFSHNTTL